MMTDAELTLGVTGSRKPDERRVPIAPSFRATAQDSARLIVEQDAANASASWTTN
jgi:hypothetical protein